MLIAEVQIALRTSHSDSLSGEKSVRFESSPTNSVNAITHAYTILSVIVIKSVLQQIESWWS